MKIEVNFVNQIRNLALTFIVIAFYYSSLFYLNMEFFRFWYSHIPAIIFLVPTLVVHILYLIENYNARYVVDQNYIVDLKSKKRYGKDSIMKIEVHKFESISKTFFFPFYYYKFCRIVLKENESFVLTSLMKPDIDEFLKENVKGVLFDRYYSNFI